MDNRTYRGFYYVRLTDNRSGLWMFTNSDKMLLGLKPEEVSFAATTAELEAELHQRYPDVEPQYGRVRNCGDSIRVADKPEFLPHHDWGEVDVDRLRELTRKHKRVLLGQTPHGGFRERFETAPGFRIACKYAYYDKKRWDKFLAEERTISVSDMDHYSYRLVLELLPAYYGEPGEETAMRFLLVRDDDVSTLHFASARFVGRYHLAVALRGVKRVRRTEAFREFRRHWLTAEPENTQKWGQPEPFGPALIRAVNAKQPVAT